MFERFFTFASRKGRRAAKARKAELSGDLAAAAVLFAEAEMPEEAARVMILRGDGEPVPAKRLVHFAQAAATAPAEHPVMKEAKKKRALLVIALAGEGAVSAATRQDMSDAARELESIGENDAAAAAFARIGDVDGEARALAAAGDVEKLESVLTEQGERERADRARVAAHREIEVLASSGRRREALAAAEAFAAKLEGAARDAMTARAEQLRARRALGPTLRVVLRGRAVSLVLGDEIVVGRHEGALQVASAAVSRRHLAISRDGDAIVVRDLGSSNGTHLRGLAIAGPVRVGDGIELRLGKEVPMRISPSADLGGVEITLAGESWIAPLGPMKLGVGAWRMDLAQDGWAELLPGETPALLDGAQLVARTTLLVGDAIGVQRNGEAVLRVLG